MPRLELLVLDFDGTFTRVDQEAVPFLVAYRAGLGEVLGGRVDDEWEQARERIESDPDRYGWEHEGRIVAPSHADPYILASNSSRPCSPTRVCAMRPSRSMRKLVGNASTPP